MARLGWSGHDERGSRPRRQQLEGVVVALEREDGTATRGRFAGPTDAIPGKGDGAQFRQRTREGGVQQCRSSGGQGEEAARPAAGAGLVGMKGSMVVLGPSTGTVIVPDYQRAVVGSTRRAVRGVHSGNQIVVGLAERPLPACQEGARDGRVGRRIRHRGRRGWISHRLHHRRVTHHHHRATSRGGDRVLAAGGVHGRVGRRGGGEGNPSKRGQHLGLRRLPRSFHHHFNAHRHFVLARHRGQGSSLKR